MSTTSATTVIETSTAPSFKRGLAWAGLAGVCSCVAVCSLPLLAAGALGGTAIAAAIARFVTPGTEFVAGGVAFVVALGVVTLRARARRRRAEERAPTCELS